MIRTQDFSDETLAFLDSPEYEVWVADQIEELEGLGFVVDHDVEFIINKIDPSKPHSIINSRLDPIQEEV